MKESFQDWIGRTETVTETITPFPANALAATLNRDDPEHVSGTPLPPLWHWLHFLPVFRMDEAGHDGHAALGGFLPPIPLPRRMWAGSRLKFLAPMRIGRRLSRTSTVASVSHKAGRSGDLYFVTLRHQVRDGDVLGIEEEHDIVYRDRPRPDAPPPATAAAPESSAFSRQVHPDPVLLFRYSALTFNGHRIHYDREFCTGIEGYDGLVVHGPLLATLMLDLLRREYPAAQVRSFAFRARAPVFDTHDFSVHGALEEGHGAERGFRLWVRRHDGVLAVEASAVVGDA